MDEPVDETVDEVVAAMADGHGERPVTRPSGSEGLEGAWVERVRATYDEVRGPLWRALVASSSLTEVADDAMAEGFTQLLRRGDEVRDPAAWVWRASFRIAAGDLQRRSQAAARRAGGTDDGGDDGAVAGLVGRVDRLPDDAIDLVRALARLSEQQRRCVALVDVAGHTAPSAAAVLGTSAATVRVQLMRARRHLRTLLADHERAPVSSTTSGQSPVVTARAVDPDPVRPRPTAGEPGRTGGRTVGADAALEDDQVEGER